LVEDLKNSINLAQLAVPPAPLQVPTPAAPVFILKTPFDEELVVFKFDKAKVVDPTAVPFLFPTNDAR
jgi:hypothetical protein